MATFWYLVLGLLFVAYFLLAGLDIGVGLLLLGRPGDLRRDELNALGPFFLGNEVWIVGVVGVLAAAFPKAEAALLTTASPLVIALVLGLAGINAGVQLRSRSGRPAVRRGFDVLIAASAAVLGLGWGALLGDLLTGLPVGAGTVTVNGGFPAVAALALALVAATHGAVFLAWRLTGSGARERYARLGRRLAACAALVLVAAAGYGFADDRVRAAVRHPVAALVLAGCVVAAVLAGAVLAPGRPAAAVAATGLAMSLPVILVGVATYPQVIVSTVDTSGSLAVPAAAASPAILHLVTWLAAPFVPLLFALQALSWWLFRQRAAATVRHW